MGKILSPSILACDFLNLGKEIKKVELSGAKYIHIDVMDGVFVPNISFGMPIIYSVRKITDLVLDVHLMITDPYRYIDEFVKCGADIITFHYESETHENVKKTIELIKKHNKKVGISVKPGTDIEEIYKYLYDVDMVLVMTVEPGFGGQSFNYDMIDKIEKLREYITSHNLNIDIEVDGGINDKTIQLVSKAGANVFVLGTAFFGSKENICAEDILKKAINNE